MSERCDPSLNDDINGETTKKFARLLSAVGALGEDLHGQGIINLEKIRLTIKARKEEAKRLIKEGKSYSEAAKELGVSKGQISSDINDTDISVAVQELNETVQKVNSKARATKPLKLDAYLPPPKAREIEPSEEALTAIDRIISEWSEIKTVIERILE